MFEIINDTEEARSEFKNRFGLIQSELYATNEHYLKELADIYEMSADDMDKVRNGKLLAIPIIGGHFKKKAVFVMFDEK